MTTLMNLEPIRSLVADIDLWDPKRHPRQDQEFDYIDISSVDREAKRVNGISRIRLSDAPSRARQRVQPGDVLVSTVRPNLNAVAVVPPGLQDGTASTGFCVLRPRNKDIDHRYLYYWVRTPQFIDSMTRLATGASYPAVTDRTILNSTVPVPRTSTEQRRIADILDESDALRQKRAEAIQLASDLVPSIFYEMFGDPLTNPKRWQLEPLGRNLTFITSGSRGWAEYYVDHGKRFIRSLDVQMNEISDDEPCYVDPPSGTEAERTRVKDGDVLLTITGSKIGRVAFVPDGFGEAYVSQHVAILRLKPKLRPRFLSMFLSLPNGGQLQIKRTQYGQTKPGLSLEHIRNFAIPSVKPDLQDNFCEVWSQYGAVLAEMRTSNCELDNLFHSLLQRAFRGEL